MNSALLFFIMFTAQSSLPFSFNIISFFRKEKLKKKKKKRKEEKKRKKNATKRVINKLGNQEVADGARAFSKPQAASSFPSSDDR